MFSSDNFGLLFVFWVMELVGHLQSTLSSKEIPQSERVFPESWNASLKLWEVLCSTHSSLLLGVQMPLKVGVQSLRTQQSLQNGTGSHKRYPLRHSLQPTASLSSPPGLYPDTWDLGVTLSILGKGLLKAKATSWSLAQQLQGKIGQASNLTEANLAGKSWP